MRALYRISAQDIGSVALKKRRIAKALRWWLRENELPFEYSFYIVR